MEKSKRTNNNMKLPEQHGRDYAEKLLCDMFQQLVQMEEWHDKNFPKKRQDYRRRSNLIMPSIQHRRPERQPTVEINTRLTSFLEYDNSFLSPWNFNACLNDDERERERVEKNWQRCVKNMPGMQGSFRHDHDHQASSSSVRAEAVNGTGDQTGKNGKEKMYDHAN